MTFGRHIAYGPWSKCVHESCVFDTPGELKVAIALDQSPDVTWWLRNDPTQFVIPTPAGNFEPDFLYCRNGPQGEVTGILEVKGEYLYEEPTSRARLKARAAVAWVRSANTVAPWEFVLLGDQEAHEVLDLAAILSAAYIVESVPAQS